MPDELFPAYRYTVQAYGSHYKDRRGHRSGHFAGYPCAICGKDVKEPRFGGFVGRDGEWLDAGLEDNWVPVGSDCHRRYLVRNG